MQITGLSMIIQIYEIQDPREAEELIYMGVDHIGSVVLEKERWKQENLKTVVSMCKEAKKRSSMIFLFQDIEVLKKAIEYYEPDILHLCEDITAETESYIERQVLIKNLFPQLMIMRSIPVPPKGNKWLLSIEKLKAFEPYTDIFLIDTYVNKPPVNGYIGITGRTCDWNLAKRIVDKLNKPVLLGGGLNPSNVYKAISIVKPYGVDSCTGTNMVDNFGKPIRFKKDMNKVRSFIEECRRYEREKSYCQGAA